MNHPDTPGPARVLVVDDHRISRQFTVAALRQKGCAVKQAGSLKTGLEKALEWQPDEIFIDWNLGDGTGGELLCLIRSNWPARHRLPRFSLLTGEREESLPPGVLDTGFDRILCKPCSSDELAGSPVAGSGNPCSPGRTAGEDVARLFRAELQSSLEMLDRLIADRRTAEAAEITHRVVAGGVLCGSKTLESAFRRLDASCRAGESPGIMATDWCRAHSAARDWLAGVPRP